MVGSRKVAFVIIFLLFTNVLFPQDTGVSASAFFEDGREYFADAAGYHGFGTATLPESGEAERLAKAAALQKIFLEIGKDELFQEICISLWPESIRQEDFSVRKNPNGSYSAAVRILLERTAVILTEQNYSVNASSLLDKGEANNNRIQDLVNSGLKAEEGMQLPEAMIFFRQAKSGCLEVRTLLKKIADNSVVSQNGLTRSSILQITASLEQASDDGFARIEKAEQALKISGKVSETEESLRLFEAELAEVSAIVQNLLELSPFFDLPKEKLEAVSIDLGNAERKTSLLSEKYRGIRPQADTDRSSTDRRQDIPVRSDLDPSWITVEKINIALSDLRTISDHIAKMRNEVAEEMRYPRLARQEDAYRRAEFFKTLGNTVSWFFFHDPNDYLRVNWEIPYGYVLRKGWTGGLDSDLAITAEGTFSSGFWVQTAFTIEETPFFTLPVPTFGTDISQNVALGVFKDSLFGIGFSWDWGSSLNSGGTVDPLDSKSKIVVYLGSVDTERLRPSLLFSAAWTIPTYWDGLILPYHVNADFLVTLRLENILIIEGGLNSGCRYFDRASGGFENNLVYSLSWKAGAALRFPGPFAWGVRFTGGMESGLSAGMPARLQEKPSSWRGFIQYSF